MLTIQKLSSEPLQTQSIVLEDGRLVTVQFQFKAMQQGWFINSLVIGDFTLNGIRIVNSPNFLYQWQNVLNFGMACVSKGQREPSLIGDFELENSKLYIITEAEMAELREYLTGG